MVSPLWMRLSVGGHCTSRKGAWPSTLNIKKNIGLLIVLFLPIGYGMLMRPNKAETAVHGCHCPSDTCMAVRMPDHKLVFQCVDCFHCLKGVTFVVDCVKCVPIPIKIV